MKNTKTVQSYTNTSVSEDRASNKNTKYGFSDRTAVKAQNKREEPKDGVKSPWDFRCPQYDQRSSNFVNAGTHYGVGFAQPVGHTGDPQQIVDALPITRVNTLQNDDEG
jgi:hypothetical protein